MPRFDIPYVHVSEAVDMMFHNVCCRWFLYTQGQTHVTMIYIIVHFDYHLITFTTGWNIPLSLKIPQSILTRSFVGIIKLSLVKTIGIDIQQRSAGYDDKSPRSMVLMNRNYSYISTLYPYEWIKSLVICTCFVWIYLSSKFIIKHIHRHQTRHQSLKILKLSSLSLLWKDFLWTVPWFWNNVKWKMNGR